MSSIATTGAPADQIWKGIYAHRRQSSTALQFTRHKTLMLEGLQFARYARLILRIYFSASTQLNGEMP